MNTWRATFNPWKANDIVVPVSGHRTLRLGLRKQVPLRMAVVPRVFLTTEFVLSLYRRGASRRFSNLVTTWSRGGNNTLLAML